MAPAISNYNRAIKLDKKSSSYHSNLGTAYFEQKDFESARKQFAIALKLDPQMFNRRRGTAGITAHMLSPEDHARFCFEMARLYAKNGDEENMLHSLQRASEGGFDVASEMRFDRFAGTVSQRSKGAVDRAECPGSACRTQRYGSRGGNVASAAAGFA